MQELQPFVNKPLTTNQYLQFSAHYDDHSIQNTSQYNTYQTSQHNTYQHFDQRQEGVPPAIHAQIVNDVVNNALQAANQQYAEMASTYQRMQRDSFIIFLKGLQSGSLSQKKMLEQVAIYTKFLQSQNQEEDDRKRIANEAKDKLMRIANEAKDKLMTELKSVVSDAKNTIDRQESKIKDVRLSCYVVIALLLYAVASNHAPISWLFVTAISTVVITKSASKYSSMLEDKKKHVTMAQRLYDELPTASAEKISNISLLTLATEMKIPTFFTFVTNQG